MSEYKGLLEAYFSAKGSNHPEDSQIVQNVINEIVQELVKVLETGEGNDIKNLYQHLDGFIKNNNTTENKEKVIYLFNDLEMQLEKKRI